MCDIDYVVEGIPCKYCNGRAYPYAKHPVEDWIAFECRHCLKRFHKTMKELREEHICKEHEIPVLVVSIYGHCKCGQTIESRQAISLLELKEYKGRRLLLLAKKADQAFSKLKEAPCSESISDLTLDL